MRAQLERILLNIWFAPTALARAASAMLLPLSWLTRRHSHQARTRVNRASSPDRPIVIVIGNLVVGGAGKTPACLAIAEHLRSKHWRVGLLSHAYRASSASAQLVDTGSSASLVGDEAVLLARTSQLPVASGRDRAQALALLCRHHPDLQVVLSDDGLQHAGLVRDLELAVFGARGAGNQRLLPAGPLREPLRHLDQMDAILLNGTAHSPHPHRAQFSFRIEPQSLLPLQSFLAHAPAPSSLREAADAMKRLRPGELVAIAGISEPSRLTQTLRSLGIVCPVRPLGDHALLNQALLNGIDAKAIIMTAKDAVKLAGCSDNRCWVLTVGAQFDADFTAWLDSQMARLGASAAARPTDATDGAKLNQTF